MINSLFAMYKSHVCHIIWRRTGIGVPVWKYYFHSLYLCTVPVNRMEKPISQINNARSAAALRTTNNGNCFIEQYEWTIGVCITVQIGERGNFTDVQIGERGKQRVKQNTKHCFLM